MRLCAWYISSLPILQRYNLYQASQYAGQASYWMYENRNVSWIVNKRIYIYLYIYIYRQAFSVHLITTFFFHVEFRDVHKWHLHIPNIWHEQSTSHQAFCTMVFIMGTILVNRSYFTGGWSEMFSSLVQHSLGLSYTGGRPGHLSFMCR